MARKTGVPGPGAYRYKENTGNVLSWDVFIICDLSIPLTVTCGDVQPKVTTYGRTGPRQHTSSLGPLTGMHRRRSTWAESWPTLAMGSESLSNT